MENKLDISNSMHSKASVRSADTAVIRAIRHENMPRHSNNTPAVAHRPSNAPARGTKSSSAPKTKTATKAKSESKTEVKEELQAYMPYGQEQVSNLKYMDSEALEPVKADLIERWNKEFK